MGPEQIPVEDRGPGTAPSCASSPGGTGSRARPARFAVNVQILDIELKPDTEYLYERPPNMDNVMFMVWTAARLNGANTLYQRQICRFDDGGKGQG